jgi:signal peptidase I
VKRGAALVLGVLALAARRRLLLVRVVGASMEPWAAAGDRLLARRGAGAAQGASWSWGRPPALGAGAEGAGLFVKRVAAVAGDPAGHLTTVARRHRHAP